VYVPGVLLVYEAFVPEPAIVSGPWTVQLVKTLEVTLMVAGVTGGSLEVGTVAE
jgi:hypothetical protein